MANNRLYIVDTSTKEYLLIAKGHGIAWDTGNVDLYQSFLATRFNDADEGTSLILGTENDESFCKKWIEKGVNFNESNKWE